MMATILRSARLFKATVEKICETKQTITKNISKICRRAKSLVHRCKKNLRSFFTKLKTKKPKKNCANSHLSSTQSKR
ncbi:MAG: hypothetical protein AB8G05_17970 [Oligoflexales bacterium]